MLVLFVPLWWLYCICKHSSFIWMKTKLFLYVFACCVYIVFESRILDHYIFFHLLYISTTLLLWSCPSREHNGVVYAGCGLWGWLTVTCSIKPPSSLSSTLSLAHYSIMSIPHVYRRWWTIYFAFEWTVSLFLSCLLLHHFMWQLSLWWCLYHFMCTFFYIKYCRLSIFRVILFTYYYWVNLNVVYFLVILGTLDIFWSHKFNYIRIIQSVLDKVKAKCSSFGSSNSDTI